MMMMMQTLIVFAVASTAFGKKKHSELRTYQWTGTLSTSVPKSSLNFYPPRLHFLFSDSRVVRSKVVIIRRRGAKKKFYVFFKNFFFLELFEFVFILIFWFSGFRIFFFFFHLISLQNNEIYLNYLFNSLILRRRTPLISAQVDVAADA